MRPINVDDSLAERRAEEESLRRLLREAGRREDVPEEDFTVIKRAALGEWSEAVVTEQRRQRRGHLRGAFAAAAGLTALVVLVSLWWNLDTAPGGSVAVAELITGQVSVIDADGENPATASTDFSVGDVIRTDGTASSASRIALRLASGHSLRLDRASTVELGAGSVTVRQGAIYVDSGGSASQPLEVVTDWGVVRELGTQYEVRVEDETAALRVRVREGEVGVQAGAAVQTVVPGEELVVDRYGAGTRSTIPLSGNGWDWVLEIAPVPEIDGQPLSSFLDWFSQETGLVPRFEDSNLAERAPEIRIHGAVSGMSPMQALEVVLAGSDLDYRIEGGDLVLERP